MEDSKLKHSTLFGRSRLAGLLCVGALGFAAQAQAAAPVPLTAGYCWDATASGGISTGDVTLNSGTAKDCYGVVGGNINSAGDLNGLNLTWGTNWAYLDSTDGNSATWMGLEFTVSAPLTTGGDWTLTGTDTDLSTPLNFPLGMDLVVALKASDRYALWAFDDLTVNSGDNDGTFTIVFKNNGGQIPDLSHMTVFGRAAEGGTIPVPEAETYAMMLAGLGLVGFAAARRRRG
jgi:hypothetical protein